MYKVGDTIKLKEYKIGKMPRHIVSQMLDFLGMTMVIKKKTKLDKVYVYALKECNSLSGGWWWREDDFVSENDMNMFEFKEFEL